MLDLRGNPGGYPFDIASLFVDADPLMVAVAGGADQPVARTKLARVEDQAPDRRDHRRADRVGRRDDRVRAPGRRAARRSSAGRPQAACRSRRPRSCPEMSRSPIRCRASAARRRRRRSRATGSCPTSRRKIRAPTDYQAGTRSAARGRARGAQGSALISPASPASAIGEARPQRRERRAGQQRGAAEHVDRRLLADADRRVEPRAKPVADRRDAARASSSSTRSTSSSVGPLLGCLREHARRAGRRARRGSSATRCSDAAARRAGAGGSARGRCAPRTAGAGRAGDTRARRASRCRPRGVSASPRICSGATYVSVPAIRPRNGSSSPSTCATPQSSSFTRRPSANGLSADEDVVELEVAVDDAGRVSGAQHVAQLEQDLDRLAARRRGPSIDARAERHALRAAPSRGTAGRRSCRSRTRRSPRGDRCGGRSAPRAGTSSRGEVVAEHRPVRDLDRGALAELRCVTACTLAMPPRPSSPSTRHELTLSRPGARRRDGRGAGDAGVAGRVQWRPLGWTAAAMCSGFLACVGPALGAPENRVARRASRTPWECVRRTAVTAQHVRRAGDAGSPELAPTRRSS